MSPEAPAPTFDIALVDSELPSLIRKPILGSAIVDRNRLLAAAYPIFVAGSLLGAAEEIDANVSAWLVGPEDGEKDPGKIIDNYGRRIAAILQEHRRMVNGPVLGHVLFELIADTLDLDLDGLQQKAIAVGSAPFFAVISLGNKKVDPQVARRALLEAFRGGLSFGVIYRDQVRSAYEEAAEEVAEDEMAMYGKTTRAASFDEAQVAIISQANQFLVDPTVARAEDPGYDAIVVARELSKILRQPAFGEPFVMFTQVLAISYRIFVGGCVLGSARANRTNPYAGLVGFDQAGTTELLISSVSRRIAAILGENREQNENVFLRILLNLNKDLLDVDLAAVERLGIPAGSPDILDQLNDPKRKLDPRTAVRALRSAYVGGVVYGVEHAEASERTTGTRRTASTSNGKPLVVIRKRMCPLKKSRPSLSTSLRRS